MTWVPLTSHHIARPCQYISTHSLGFDQRVPRAFDRPDLHPTKNYHKHAANHLECSNDNQEPLQWCFGSEDTDEEYRYGSPGKYGTQETRRGCQPYPFGSGHELVESEISIVLAEAIFEGNSDEDFEDSVEDLKIWVSGWIARMIAWGEKPTTAASMSQSSTASTFVTAIRTQKRMATTISARALNVQVTPITTGPRPRSSGFNGSGNMGIPGDWGSLESAIVSLCSCCREMVPRPQFRGPVEWTTGEESPAIYTSGKIYVTVGWFSQSRVANPNTAALGLRATKSLGPFQVTSAAALH